MFTVIVITDIYVFPVLLQCFYIFDSDIKSFVETINTFYNMCFRFTSLLDIFTLQ
jgi:hypothetical protein